MEITHLFCKWAIWIHRWCDISRCTFFANLITTMKRHYACCILSLISLCMELKWAQHLFCKPLCLSKPDQWRASVVTVDDHCDADKSSDQRCFRYLPIRHQTIIYLHGTFVIKVQQSFSKPLRLSISSQWRAHDRSITPAERQLIWHLMLEIHTS
jgi:hypothetical protein